MNRFVDIPNGKVYDILTDVTLTKLDTCLWCGSKDTLSDITYQAMCRDCADIYRTFQKHCKPTHDEVLKTLITYYKQQLASGYKVPEVVRKGYARGL